MIILMKYEAYIFDFDFTLADATPGIVASANYALTVLGLAEASTEKISKTVGMSLAESFFVLTGISDKIMSTKFASLFKEKADIIMTDNTVLFPETVNTLARLKERNSKTAIVTSKLRYRIEEALQKFDISGLIDYIVGFEDVEEAKPSPEGLLKAIERLSVDKDMVLYIGDSIIDAKTAANASVDFAAITTGTTTRSDFAAFKSILITDNLSEITALS